MKFGLFEGVSGVTIGKIFAVGFVISVIYHPNDIVLWLFWGSIFAEAIEKLLNVVIDIFVPERRGSKPWGS